MDEWSKISGIVAAYAKRAFDEELLGVTDAALEDDLRIFNNMIDMPTGYPLLDGFHKKMRPALKDACIDKVGEVNPLEILLDCIDSFMKRLLLFSGKCSYSAFNKRMTAMPLFELCGVAPTFTVGAGLDSDSEVYRGNADGLYLFARAYHGRNQVHNSPEWLPSDVTDILKYLMGFFLWVIERMKLELQANAPALFADAPAFQDTEEMRRQALLYDGVCYSKSIFDVKTRLINGVISTILLDEGAMSAPDLMVKTNQKLEHKFDARPFTRKMENCSKAGILVLDKFSNTVSLSEAEKTRLQNLRSDLAVNKEYIRTEISNVLKDYGVEDKAEETLDALMRLYEKNSRLSLIDEVDAEDESDNIRSFKDELRGIGVADASIAEAARRLVDIAKDNKYIPNIAICKSIGSLSNMDVDNPYVERTIYVDTQVVLYLLCLHGDMPVCDIPILKAVKTLSEIILSKKNFTFKFSRHYMREVLGNIEDAVALIPLVDNSRWKGCLSQNVFYQHFYRLRLEGSLPEGVESFADYVDYQFDLTYDDYLAGDVYSVAKHAMEKKLTDLFVHLDLIEMQSESTMEEHKKAFGNVLSNSDRWKKTPEQLEKDAWMGAFLFGLSKEEGACPFFITLDGSFFKYRDFYLKRINRSSVSCWRGFTPNRFVNNIDINELHIKEDFLTSDILMILNNEPEQNVKFFDALNKLTSSNSLSQKNRERLQRRLLEIDTKADAEEDEGRLMVLARVIDGVYTYFKEKSMWSAVCAAMDDDHFIDRFILAIKGVTEPTEENISNLNTEIEGMIK